MPLSQAVTEIWSTVVAKNHWAKLISGNKFIFVYDNKTIKRFKKPKRKKMYAQTETQKNVSKSYNWHGAIAVE